MIRMPTHRVKKTHLNGCLGIVWVSLFWLFGMEGGNPELYQSVYMLCQGVYTTHALVE